jgi:hypothetical protein
MVNGEAANFEASRGLFIPKNAGYRPATNLTPRTVPSAIDLWAALHHKNLRQAALDLVHTFDLEPAPGTEKRQG